MLFVRVFSTRMEWGVAERMDRITFCNTPL